MFEKQVLRNKNAWHWYYGWQISKGLKKKTELKSPPTNLFTKDLF